jgi:hypothetical protein
LGRQLDSKSWSSRGTFMYSFSIFFIMCFLDERERGDLSWILSRRQFVVTFDQVGI